MAYAYMHIRIILNDWYHLDVSATGFVFTLIVVSIVSVCALLRGVLCTAATMSSTRSAFRGFSVLE